MKVEEFIELMCDMFGADFHYCIDYRHNMLHFKIIYRTDYINMDLAFHKITSSTPRSIMDVLIKQLTEQIRINLLRDANLMIARQEFIGKPLAELRGDNDET